MLLCATSQLWIGKPAHNFDEILFFFQLQIHFEVNVRLPMSLQRPIGEGDPWRWQKAWSCRSWPQAGRCTGKGGRAQCFGWPGVTCGSIRNWTHHRITFEARSLRSRLLCSISRAEHQLLPFFLPPIAPTTLAIPKSRCRSLTPFLFFWMVY